MDSMETFTANVRGIMASIDLRDHIIAEQDELIKELRDHIAIIERSLEDRDKLLDVVQAALARATKADVTV